MRDRGLAPTSENDERRKALAHSYHGDVEALVLDTSRQELVELFKSSFEARGVESFMSNAESAGTDCKPSRSGPS